MITTKEVAWLAGIIEGEGYIGLRKGRYPCIQVRMTDKDIIEKVNKYFRATIFFENKYPNKDSYCVRSSHITSVPLLMTIYSLMGTRRKQRIREVLSAWRTWKSVLRPGTNKYWNKNKHKYVSLYGTRFKIKD